MADNRQTKSKPAAAPPAPRAGAANSIRIQITPPSLSPSAGDYLRRDGGRR